MTNYRLKMCECKFPEFNYCFTCGARLKEIGITNILDWGDEPVTETMYQCSHDGVHLKLWTYTHNEENDSCYQDGIEFD